MSRVIIDENNNEVLVNEIEQSGHTTMPEGGNFAQPTISTLVFNLEDGKQVTRTAKVGDIDNMTDDQLLDLLKKDDEVSE